MSMSDKEIEEAKPQLSSEETKRVTDSQNTKKLFPDETPGHGISSGWRKHSGNLDDSEGEN